MPMDSSVKKLSDYPAIKKLAAALHQFNANEQGAAIMIGAGFSRSAAVHINKEIRMPLWDALSRRLLEKTSPDSPELNFSNPLRIAEEYRASFGSAALNDEIRTLVNNEVWATGVIYTSLLKLPWSEIMTTNWDTLLEQAAENIHSPYYTPVTKTSDLTWAESPRIVKLHGTIGITDTLIAAEEDYRKYPTNFAPFVNFVRQVFIEKELCLLGFSGDDPNFLQWTGWVRDQLKDHTRKIYLVGALNLSAAKRKYLESLNIAPIDLWSAVKHIDNTDLQHEEATKLFLRALQDEKRTKTLPHQWRPADLHPKNFSNKDHSRLYNDMEYASSLLSGQLEQLKYDRESYPGWLVCPPSLQWKLKTQLSHPSPSANNLAALDADCCAKLLYEIIWRRNTTFDYIEPWLAEECLTVANPDAPCAISKKQQLEICLALLKNSRWQDIDGDEAKTNAQQYTERLIHILEKHAQYLPDCQAELAYHRALMARDKLDFKAIENVVEDIIGEDPVWLLRQALFVMELGRYEEAKELVAQAYGKLRQNYRHDRYSVFTLSRLQWAYRLLRAYSWFDDSIEKLNPFIEGIYREWLCDPQVHINSIENKIKDEQEKQQESQNPIEPGFQQGHYKDNTNNRTFNSDTEVCLLLEGLTREVGMPLRVTGAVNVNMFANAVGDLLEVGGSGNCLADCVLAIRAAGSATSPIIAKQFSRIAIACLPVYVVKTLVEYIRSAIDYWTVQYESGKNAVVALAELIVLIEVLARLSVRLESELAKEVFILALSLGAKPKFQHHWLIPVIAHALQFSLEAISATEQATLVEQALAFPLPHECQGVTDRGWPNPVVDNVNSRDAYLRLAPRIHELIKAVGSTDVKSKSNALLRLLPLARKAHFLSVTEREQLAHAIWGDSTDQMKLPNTTLYLHVFLLLPSPDADKAEQLIRDSLYACDESVLLASQSEIRCYPSPEANAIRTLYSGMANAAINKETQLLPTPLQAQILFDNLVVWQSDDIDNDVAVDTRRDMVSNLANALAHAIVPALASEAKTLDRFKKLQLFLQLDGAKAALPGGIYFAGISEVTAMKVEKDIRTALLSGEADDVYFAVTALKQWTILAGADVNPLFISLYSRLVFTIESGRVVGLQYLLSAAKWLVDERLLSDEQVEGLGESVLRIFEEYSYNAIGTDTMKSVRASSVRADCARLTQALLQVSPDKVELTELLSEAKKDPLPEVRYALEEHIE
ncbi:MAG: hypothetical protein A6F70_08630 [Cycloclasticus sp. symbiont of Bathymodiolus heckerae]|nr:MAG: hypothetical protein A6F70_08630 [Cycloclasticus sp. symbiont of Bathymodiolus heckerae]